VTRDEAWGIVCEFVQSESLRRHMLGVEACMVKYAGKFNEDEELWAVTALLHDFDWEIHPAAPDHPMKGEAILEQRGVSPQIRRAVLSHANYSGVRRESLMERALFACDELSGFLAACAFVKPGKSIYEVDVPSVKRKLKDKAFARNVSRDDILGGAQELGIPLEDHIAFCIEALKSRASDLGLAGTANEQAAIT
jgi:putative nucleotidyltransferase with HDIG domain